MSSREKHQQTSRDNEKIFCLNQVCKYLFRINYTSSKT